MAKEKKLNWAVNIAIPEEDKEIVERWLSETDVTKTQFMVWVMNFLAGEMRRIDEFDLPANTKTTSQGFVFPIALLMGIKEGKLPMMKGNENE